MLDDIIRKVCDADEVHFEGKMRLTLSFASKAELECVRMRRSSSLRVEIARNADADEFIKLVARGLNRYNIIKRENMYTIKEHNYTVNGKKNTIK